jgi:hypothetical protein
MFSFDPKAYGDTVAAILALDGNGERLMPLALGECSSAAAAAQLRGVKARDLFAGSRAPEAALSGLWLYFSCLDESHSLSQDIGSPEGSFWHGIMHRQEPDPGNASYWFRRVGTHAVFPALRDAAEALGYSCGSRWDPFAFIDYCEQARRKPGSATEQLALRVQLAEWQLLFDYCASPLA